MKRNPPTGCKANAKNPLSFLHISHALLLRRRVTVSRAAVGVSERITLHIKQGGGGELELSLTYTELTVLCRLDQNKCPPPPPHPPAPPPSSPSRSQTGSSLRQLPPAPFYIQGKGSGGEWLHKQDNHPAPPPHPPPPRPLHHLAPSWMIRWQFFSRWL